MKIKKNKCKINSILLVTLVISIVIIILLCIFGLKNIIETVKSFDYTAIASITSIIALMVTIIISSKNQKKTIEATIKSNNQLEFEKHLYDIIDIYNKLMIDITLLKIEWENPNNSNLIKTESINTWGDCITKYCYLLDDMEHKIYFYYKYYDNLNHNELDKLIKDIQGLNQAIKIKLIEYSKLSVRASKINEEKNKMGCLINYAKIDELFNNAAVIIREASEIVSFISNLILSMKRMIYAEALNCIKEREQLIKLYNEE